VLALRTPVFLNESELRESYINIFEIEPTSSTNNNISQIIFYSKQFANFFLFANVDTQATTRTGFENVCSIQNLLKVD
jgi:hypothetical protein